jgi:D-alanyl-D-alanine dipeptidase
MERFEKDGTHWRKVGKPIPVILGRNGLGWGLGLHQIPKGAKYIKREGDGRSPAGLFHLGHGFGYEPLQIKFPYKVYTRDYHCVDDSNSKWYNKIINSKRVERDYRSFEYMKLRNNLYRYGITVKHNSGQIKNGGSCIFVHIRSKSNSGTAGCTAMNQDDIIQVLKWLKPEAKPLLLQLPIIEMRRVKLP